MSRTAVPEAAADSRDRSPRWLLDYLPALLRLATVLTGDPAAASRLVSAALAREADRPSGSVEFAEARLRALVVQQFLAADRSSSRERLSRACLALRHLEGLTLAEAATVVDRPVSMVAALSQDELEPRELRARLVQLADAAPDPQTVLHGLADASRTHGRLRRRRARLTVLGAALVAVLVLIPTVVLPRLPGETRTAGDWTLVHRVKPPRGWVVVDHLITPSYEGTTVAPAANPADAGSWCRLQVYIPAGLDLGSLPAQRDPVRVSGHQAFYSDGDGLAFGPLLAWKYSSNAWAIVSCLQDVQLDRTKLMSLAQAVSFRRTQISLPFKLATIPSGYRLESATQGILPVGAEVILAMTEIRPGDANMSITYAPMDPPAEDGSTRTVLINGRQAFLDSTSSHPRLCLAAQGTHLCISAYWPLGDWPARAPLPVNMGPVLIRTAQQLELAGALDDPGTWFAGRDALPVP